jgi:hypothetical protein
MLDAGKHLLTIDCSDIIKNNCELSNFIFDDFYKYERLLN